MPELENWRPSTADLATIAERNHVKLVPDAPRMFKQIAETTAAAPNTRAAAGTLFLATVHARPAGEESGFLALEFARVLLLLTGSPMTRIDRNRAETLIADVDSGALAEVEEIGRRLNGL